jgi:hypothetical protein
MGFSTILDIIGSIIIGGFLLLILFRINGAAVENTYNNTQELTLQQNLATSAMILEHDFRRIGYCDDYTLIETTDAIISATDSSISFKTDVTDNGIGEVNILRYYIGPPSELTSTPNPRDRFLYRVVDNETPVGVNLGITQFRLVYFDQQGDSLPFPITEPTLIGAMEINIATENVAGYDEKYSSAFWRQIRLAAQNLQRR